MVETYVRILGTDKIVKPDDLRGEYASLQAALQDKGADTFWPDVDSVRGKFFIIGGGTLHHNILMPNRVCLRSCVHLLTVGSRYT